MEDTMAVSFLMSPALAILLAAGLLAVVVFFLGRVYPYDRR